MEHIGILVSAQEVEECVGDLSLPDVHFLQKMDGEDAIRWIVGIEKRETGYDHAPCRREVNLRRRKRLDPETMKLDERLGVVNSIIIVGLPPDAMRPPRNLHKMFDIDHGHNPTLETGSTVIGSAPAPIVGPLQLPRLCA